VNTEQLFTDWSNLWRPSEALSLSRWAEKNFYLSADYSARSGPIVLFRWQRDILDSFTDPRVEASVLMTSTQMIKTLFIQAALLYVITEAPGPVLISQPKDDDAKTFSKERLDPMLRDCPALHGKVSGKKRDAENTTTFKRFPGGSISLVGANAPGNFARRSIRYFFADEIDKYPASAGKEGDPIGLGDERTVTYGSRRKKIRCCSPTVRGSSRIAKEYEKSDQRKPWVPCRSCGEFQILKWTQVKWDNALPLEDRAQTARYECEQCGALWNENARYWSCERAEWRASKPFRGVAGFWISHLYSPWKTLAEIVRVFLLAKDDREQFKMWTNTTLAELWDEPGETPDDEKLYARRESFPFGFEGLVIPRRALFVTAAVDVQDDCLWVELAGWGRNKERWSLAYEQIKVMGSDHQPLRSTDPRLWDELEKVLQRDWRHESGQTLPIAVMTIDTGSRPRPVYDFALRHAQPGYGTAGIRVFAPRTVVPVKGSSTREMQQILMGVSKEDAARRRGGVRIVQVGTAAAKQEIYDCVRDRPSEGPHPGAYRFPMYERFYFEQLCSEKKVFHDNGTVEWVKFRANHALDCAVYNRAGAAVVGIDRFGEAQWRALEAAVAPQEKVTVPSPVQQPQQQFRRPRTQIKLL
jgi:phage terminase large subunit GpA-like protein